MRFQTAEAASIGLLRAARDGQTTRIVELLDRGVDIGTRNSVSSQLVVATSLYGCRYEQPLALTTALNPIKYRWPL